LGQVAVLLLALSLVALGSCDKVPLLAPSGSTITLFANPTTIGLNGTSSVTALVYESGGTAVQNGTLVSFFTNLGTFTPSEAQTHNGSVTVSFQAGEQTGDAVINAVCGPAKLNGTVTITVTTGATVTVGDVVLSATPATVPAGGGTITLTAFVADSTGAPIPGVSVAFTTTAGSLSQPVVATDLNGEAATTLTTSVQTTVTATAGGQTASATIGVTAALAVTLAATPTSTTTNVPVTFTATASAPGGGTVPPIVQYQWNFGDGTTATTSGPQTSHAYATTGLKVATVTAVATNGATAVGRVEVVIN
jgi:hypothetical protein